jgi:ATP-dependent helicase/DNAse subunit B
LDCRLKFYLQYLANIQEKQEVSEEIDAAVFGNLAHLSMEILYQGFAKRNNRTLLEKSDFEELSKNWILPAIEQAIRNLYYLEGEADTKLNGQMVIARDVLQKYLHQILKIDEASAPFKLISLEKEKKYTAGLAINTTSGIQTVSLKGIIDRVDEHNGSVRLIDYKSGQDNKNFPDVASLFDREHKSRNKAAMQTMFYGLIYRATNPDNTLPLKPAIFNLREMFGDDFNPYLQQKQPYKTGVEVNDYREFEAEYKEALTTLLEDIYNPEIPFDQTDDLKKCEYCPYKEICGR